MDIFFQRAIEARGGVRHVVDEADLGVAWWTVEAAADRRAPATAIFLPPLGEGASTWMRLLGPLVEGAAADLVLVEPPDEPGGVRSMATWQRAVARVAPHEGRTVLVGASVGGLVALRSALDDPGRFAGVACLALRPDLGRLTGLVTTFRIETEPDVDRLIARAWASPPPTNDAVRRRLFETMRSADFRGVLEDAALQDVGALARRAIEAGLPIAFLFGSEDGILGAGLAAGPPVDDAVVHALEACGHYPWYEQPVACAGWLSAEIQRMTHRAPAAKESKACPP